MFDQPQQPQTLAVRIAAAMAEQTAWMAAEREKQRHQLRHQLDRSWREVAATIAEKRQSRQGTE
ncbi:hypothetical protein [Geminicoccus flavidas]|uniref:hypothetical protein n=1 Tax=Geminicoccus flavidas TaxID=2506407 RepID=UPI001358B829|nr:hypothetical protein [Geminicoccus flavidas]